MKEELSWMLQCEFLNDVGEMTIVPCQSTVLASQAGYREIYRHYTQLQQAALVDAGDNAWERLLELKDVALLYELWSFCETKRILEKLLGRATNVRVFASDDLKRTMKRGIALEYAGGKVSLSYNETVTPGNGSYSVSLRPDIVLRVQSGSLSRCLLLDAKLRFDGTKLRDDRSPEEWERNPVREDLVKMHAYRDAIRGVDGAYVLYPGSETVLFRTRNIDPSFSGIGAVPLEPGGDRDGLQSLLSAFLVHYQLA
jgi:predicted component of viral defense system (DUF524 family)